MENFLSDPSKNKFRLGGLVMEGRVVEPASSTEMEFVVTDLVTDILATTKNARKNDCYLAATEVLAKHDGKYMPKEVVVAIQKNRTTKGAHAPSQQQQH